MYGYGLSYKQQQHKISSRGLPSGSQLLWLFYFDILVLATLMTQHITRLHESFPTYVALMWPIFLRAVCKKVCFPILLVFKRLFFRTYSAQDSQAHVWIIECCQLFDVQGLCMCISSIQVWNGSLKPSFLVVRVK